MSNKGAAIKPIKPVKAWAICDRRGNIHVDQIMKSKAEAWGMLVDEIMPNGSCSNADLARNGYRCVRVEIRPTAERVRAAVPEKVGGKNG